MNSHLHRAFQSARRRAGGGFTIVELMLVIFIIMLLIGIGVPAIDGVRRNYRRTLSLATLNMLEKACEHYRLDFKTWATAEHPWLSYPPGGTTSLVWALIGYADDMGNDATPDSDGYTLENDDGYKGFGFRLAGRGRRYGPYGGAEQADTDGDPVAFVDAFQNPVFYYRFEYDVIVGEDGEVELDADGEVQVENERFVGLTDEDGQPIEEEGPTLPQYATRPPGEGGGYYRKDILLCTKGPDAIWGSIDADGVTRRWITDDFKGIDDVTNFLDE